VNIRTKMIALLALLFAVLICSNRRAKSRC